MPSGALRPPNVVVIMADQLKATASRLYSPTGTATPALARLAAEGVRYENAFTPHPLCVPARVSLWTGQYPHAHGSRDNQTPMPAGAAHAFKVWREAGFATALIGKDHCFQSPEDQALFDVWCEIGHEGLLAGRPARGMPWFRPEERVSAAHAARRAMPRQAPAVSYAVTDHPLEDYSTGLVAGQTARYLEERAAEQRPFALWVSFPDPHTPYEVPRAYFEAAAAEGVELPPAEPPDMPGAPERTRVLRRLLDVSGAPRADQERLLLTYRAMTRFVDDGVGAVLDALERTGLRERTIVVFLSDHGDFALEHGMARKGGAFYDCLTRVPLLVSWRGACPEGVVDGSMANLVDVVPTLLTLQGLPVPPGMQGAPLPTLTPAAPRAAAFSEYGSGGPPFTLADLEAVGKTVGATHGLEAVKASLERREAEGERRMVRTARWKYVTDPLGDIDELYDLVADPLEHRNLAGEAGHEPAIRELRELLEDWEEATRLPRRRARPPAPPQPPAPTRPPGGMHGPGARAKVDDSSTAPAPTRAQEGRASNVNYVFKTSNPKRYRFPTHTNLLVMDRAEATTSESFISVMEPGEAPPLHKHDDTEQVFYVLEGEGRLEIGPEARFVADLVPGDLVRIPPSTLHRVHCTSAVPLAYLVVDCFPGGRPTVEPTWDSHVATVCHENGWDMSEVVEG